MPRPKGLVYAEDGLGVHTVYEQAQEARAALDASFTDLDNLYSERRSLLEKIADREVEVTVEQRSAHPESSEAALERSTKTARQTDEVLRDLRARLRSCESDIDGRKFDRSIAEHDISIATARMIELGGYFAYLVQMKQQSTTTQPTQP